MPVQQLTKTNSVGSTTAFNAFVGSFVILLSLSYLAALIPHLLRRSQQVRRGPFWMQGVVGYGVVGISCAYLLVFIVIFSLPYTLPTSPQSMNYSSAIAGGITVLVTAWWFWKRKMGYEGPQLIPITPGTPGSNHSQPLRIEDHREDNDKA